VTRSNRRGQNTTIQFVLSHAKIRPKLLLISGQQTTPEMALLMPREWPMRLLLCLLIGFSRVIVGHGAEPAGTAFPFSFREGLLWVQVRVADTGRSLNFLLDSGAEASVLDLQTAKSLGLILGERVAVKGVHASTQAYWSNAKWVRAGTVPLPSRFLALDLSQLSSSCERHVDGLIGLDFFRNRVVQIDFGNGEVRLINQATNKNQPTTAVALDVRRCGMDVKASINGEKPAWFRLDTGCASGLQWVVGREIPAGCTSKVAVGLSQLGIPQIKTTIRLGNQVLADVDTGLHDSVIFDGESGLLGNGVLRQFESVTIDAIGGKLVLGPRLAYR